MDTIPENCYAAIDLGASSGRVLLGWLDQDMLKLQEVHRFDNLQQQLHGHHCWNIDGLFSEIVKGLALCKSK
ncbi:MAG: rhamnulokinase, partial [Coriobacteriaceae bacterium]